MADPNPLRRFGVGRRLFPRLAVDGTLLVRDVTIGLTMSVEDLSAGGFRTISPVIIRPGARHIFEVLQPASEPLRLVSRVVHCQGVSKDRAPYVIGWEFERDFATAQNVVRLLDYVSDADAFQPRSRRSRA